MADATPTTFELKERHGSVGFDELRVHRSVETDKAGHSRMHVWVTGRAVAHEKDSFQSISANVAFSLFDGSTLVGVCTAQGLTFAEDEQSHPVTADEGLYLEMEASITHVEAQVETTKVVRGSAKLTFNQT